MADDPTIAHVRARREEVMREMEALRAELTELDVAERVLTRLAMTQPGSSADLMLFGVAASTVVLPPIEQTPHQRAKGTLEEMIRTFLLEGHKTGWATSSEVKEFLTWRTGRDVPMSSVSPTLSNMKAKGVVIRDRGKVAAPERAGLGSSMAARENGQAALILSSNDLVPDPDGDDIVTTSDADVSSSPSS